jgi:nitric-oxide synthase
VSASAPDGRAAEADAEISHTGTYRHSAEELLIGARIAWRNHARCNGRYSWRSLTLNDARDAVTPSEVAERCVEHLVLATNGGKLRPVITVMAARAPGRPGIRIHNPQLIRYAGYQRAGRIAGDPLHVDLTQQAEALGWNGAGGRFDVLPMMISVDGERPCLFPVPAEALLEVPLRHPRFEWFAELGLRWHANPAISNLTLEIGGLEYTAAPFSGWYVSSEIGARNLSDASRYDQLPEIARRMGLDTGRNGSLWRDRALVELNEAVLYSYAQAGVYIVDHHTAAAQFVSHVEREQRHGRRVATDWAWVNPPLSASTTPTFHRSFDPPEFEARPNFVSYRP